MREASVLKSIEDGARTLFEVVTTTYRDLDPIFWYHAGSNVRVYVEHLAHQDKLPKVISTCTKTIEIEKGKSWF